MNHSTIPFTVLLLCFVCACAPRTSFIETDYRVTVEAGDFDRANTPVSFAWPGGLERGPFVLEGGGDTVPVQLDDGDRAWFIVDRLPAGGSRTYRLLRADSAGPWSVDAMNEGGAVSFQIDGSPVFTYQGSETALPRADIDPVMRRGAYVHPVYTPSGRLVSDHYPLNHVHQNGIWAAWSGTRFQGRIPDFWNMAEGTGTVRPLGMDHIWEGPVHGGLQARHAYVDLSATPPTAALNEEWRMQVFDTHDGVNPYWLFDLDLVQTAATDSALYLTEYLYGGLAFRGNWDWNGPDDAFFLTAEGKDRTEGDSSAARWVHMGGDMDGARAGVAILGHPANFRAPQPVRLHPNEPYFTFAPTQQGPFAIRPGEPYVLRYRFVVSDGPPDAALLDRLWNDYAYPPVVTIDD